MIELEHKRGDTLLISWTINGAGVGTEAPFATFASQIRKGGSITATPSLSVSSSGANAVTVEALVLPATSAALSLGQHLTDLQMTTSAGVVISTPTVAVNIIEDITQ